MNLKNKKKSIILLGATGSIGKSVIDIIDKYPNLFQLVAVSANSNVKSLLEIIKKHKPDKACFSGIGYNDDIVSSSPDCQILFGKQKLINIVKTKADLIIVGISGFAGIFPIFEALKIGTNIAIANKEPLVAAGNLFKHALNKSKSNVLPIDSEHNAIFQLLEKNNIANISSITLTASGGPFLNDDIATFRNKLPSDALKNPNWEMGKKVSIDSATMMNKGLEIIEASVLFSLNPKKINVLVHPQSIVHGMINLVDGSIISYLSDPDMRVPIFNVLTWPNTIKSFKKTPEISNLNFMKVNNKKFPSINIAREAINKGFIACNYFNASNEVAVSAFLEDKISFINIFDIVRLVTDIACKGDPKDLNEVIEYDNLAREFANKLVSKNFKKRKNNAF